MSSVTSDHSMEDNDEYTSSRRRHSHMTLEEEQERRASIRDILQDDDLSPAEKRHSIQSLMDGRRRSSGGPMSMAAAAAVAAAEFYDSSDDDDMMDVSSSQHHYPPPPNSSSTSSSSTLLGAVPTTPTFSLQYFSREKVGRSASLQTFGTGAAAAAAAAAAATMEVSQDATDIINTSRTMETSRPPCNHYERNCTIIAPCCGLAFGCRICHDECPVLPPPITSAVPPEEFGVVKRRRSLPTSLEAEMTHHNIDRFAIQEVICRRCFTRQSSKTNKCCSCGILFGKYHCLQCNLWMSDDESPYHCHDCGFCRVGGRESFQHCHDCGMCIDATVYDNHNCKAGKYMSNCPVCQEDLFSSRLASHEMPCGHAIHWHCFQELTSYDTRCPVCKKTAETREQMAATWSAIAVGISLQPVPPEMARVVTIICNDCEKREDNRQWHFLGVQCRNCTSFNTSVEKITLMGRQAAGAGISPPPPPSNSTTAENRTSPNHNDISVTLS